MPIKVQSDLPAREILERENIFVMDENRAVHQDIRPIHIAILNLMPLKEEDNQQFREQFEEYGKEYALPARIKGTPKVDMRARMTAG